MKSREDLEKELRHAIDALSFYANSSNYFIKSVSISQEAYSIDQEREISFGCVGGKSVFYDISQVITSDNGKKARDALSKITK